MERVLEVVRCNNKLALDQSRASRRSVRSSAKQADILRALQSIKVYKLLYFKYEWIWSDQDKKNLWHQLSLVAQLNAWCNELANASVRRIMGYI